MTDNCSCIVHIFEGKTKFYESVAPKGMAKIVGAFIASKDAHMLIMTKDGFETKTVRKESEEDSQK